MPYSRSKEDKFNSDVTIIPDYLFRDINTKCTFRNEQYLFIRLSMMAGQDKFSYMLDEMLTRWYRLEKIPQRQVSRKDHPWSLKK